MGLVLNNADSVNDDDDGGSYLLVAPDWNDQVPPGIKRAIKGESAILGTLMRTRLVGSMSDLPAADAVRQQCKLLPSSAFPGHHDPWVLDRSKW